MTERAARRRSRLVRARFVLGDQPLIAALYEPAWSIRRRVVEMSGSRNLTFRTWTERQWPLLKARPVAGRVSKGGTDERQNCRAAVDYGRALIVVSSVVHRCGN